MRENVVVKEFVMMVDFGYKICNDYEKVKQCLHDKST